MRRDPQRRRSLKKSPATKADEARAWLGDQAADRALLELAEILMDIAETAGEATGQDRPDADGPTDSKTKGKRQSDQRRVKGDERHDRK